MSGIVRGWADAQALGETAAALERETIASVTLSRIEISGDIPVAVVPLDDATLAGMIERMLRFRVKEHADVCNVNADHVWTFYSREFSESALRELRAALGLEGGA